MSECTGKVSTAGAGALAVGSGAGVENRAASGPVTVGSLGVPTESNSPGTSPTGIPTAISMSLPRTLLTDPDDILKETNVQMNANLFLGKHKIKRLIKSLKICVLEPHKIKINCELKMPGYKQWRQAKNTCKGFIISCKSARA
jgi:hypothetical protein